MLAYDAARRPKRQAGCGWDAEGGTRRVTLHPAKRSAWLSSLSLSLVLCAVSSQPGGAQAVRTERVHSPSAWAWGDNGGRLGDGGTLARVLPAPVVGPSGREQLDDLIALSAGSDHTLAVRRDGSVWSWGVNYYGSLGDGTNTTRNAQVQVLQGLGRAITATVAAGATHSLAITSDRTT